MATTLHTTFSNAFSLMKMYEFPFKFNWSLFLKVQLTIFQNWFRQWLGAVQWWLDYQGIYVSLGLNELNCFSSLWHWGTVSVTTSNASNSNWAVTRMSLLFQGIYLTKSKLYLNKIMFWLTPSLFHFISNIWSNSSCDSSTSDIAFPPVWLGDVSVYKSRTHVSFYLVSRNIFDSKELKMIYQWLGARLWYLQCISTGDTTVLHKTHW